jgi:hypothetical protein
MTPKDILKIIKKIQNEVKEDKEKGYDIEETKYRLTEKYSDFSMKCPVLFLKTINEGLDMEQFTYMVNMATEVVEDKTDRYDASVKVGEKLVDQYVKPSLQKIKKNKNG